MLVRCGQQVLLMGDSDPGVPGSAWWVLPGGGIDPDEDARLAAARELFEETGHRCDPSRLVGPIAHRVAVHGYSDRVLVQDELLFGLDLAERFDVDTAGFTASELTRMGPWGWFGVDELAGRWVWPQQVAQLLVGDWQQCRELGTQHESTVAVDD